VSSTIAARHFQGELGLSDRASSLLGYPLLRLVALCVALVVCTRATAAPDNSKDMPPASASPSAPHLDGASVQPFPLHMINSKVPAALERKKKQGEVVLHATIATDGTVKDVAILSGDPRIANAIADSVRQWRYLPAMREGNFVEATKEISVAYRFGKHVSRPEEPATAVPRQPTEDVLGQIARGELFLGGGTDITPPHSVGAPDPEYSENARIERFQGSLELGVIVGTDGNPRSFWVVRPLGHGLDEQAMRAIEQWKFKPAMKNDKPVAAWVNVEMSFSLSDGEDPKFEFGTPARPRPK